MARQVRDGTRRGFTLRVHFNQLALFGEALNEAITQTSTEVEHEGTHGARRGNIEALEGALSGDGAGAGAEETPQSGAVRSAGPDRRDALPNGVGAEDGLSGGLGDRGAIGVPAGDGADSKPAAVAEIETEQPPAQPSRDFRIEDFHGIGEGGLKEKARANIEAIRIVKEVEAAGREATEDEKLALVRYVGWGAMGNVFHPYPPPEWRDLARAVRGILTDEEWESARASTPNAHYTSPAVIRAIWEAMQRFGLETGAQILEPSMGAGHFFGLMPESLLAGSRRTGVELDSITARIAKQLYPDARVFAQGFEDTHLPDNFFDAVIGNIPFGNYPVHDPAYRRSALTRTIHDYFFAKSLDKLRPGGVMALVTSRYTMDKRDSSIRRHLAERADLIGAIRLPNTTFKDNAGTEVTTDIMMLRKRASGVSSQGESWTELQVIDTPEGSVAINEYFGRHPEMMLGEMRLEGSMYSQREPALIGELSPERLAQAVALLPEGIYAPRSSQDRGPPERTPPYDARTDLNSDVKDGAYAVREDRLVIRNGDTFDVAKVPAALAWRIRGLLGVRDAVRDVFRTQLGDESEERIVQARRVLNDTYDAFVRRYGPLSSRENVRAFAGDPDLPLLLSLETYDAEKKHAAKTAIFERRTLERYKPVERAETASEALAVSLNETASVQWERMEQLTGRSAKSLQRELGSLVYCNPEGGWETADRYLSGDVRAKLRSAEAAAALDAVYVRNIDALKAVQPGDLQPGEIDARLGSSWIPAGDVRNFVCSLLDVNARHVRVGHAEAIATWTVEVDAFERGSVGNTTTYGTNRTRATDLIEDALNGRVPTVYDRQADGSSVINQQETIAAREKQQQLKDRFRDWIWQDEERAARLSRDYNDRFNNIRLRSFDGSHLTLPGMNRTYLRDGDLSRHQKDAVWRCVQSGSTLLAHVVGAGKTWTMAAAAMELKRLGLAKKPMFVVPNHLVEQWGAEFLKIYPQAKLFIAGKEHFSAGNRQQAMARIASGAYDAVIVSHRSFEFLPVSDELFNRFVQEQVRELEGAILEASAEKGSKRLVKELEKAKKRFTVKLKERADRETKDKTITFEELGVDQVFVDEADLYKNLFFTTKMNRIAGLPNSESNRAMDMYIKTRYIREVTGGRGVVFATGTPISNTMGEMYTMMRYLAPDLLAVRGVSHFDAWAANFGEAVTTLELAPDGSGYRMHTRFAKFINLPELLSMFRMFADVQTADMLNLPRPAVAGGRPRVVAAPASPSLKAYVKTLTERAERLRTGRVDPSIDNMLKITGDGRKAALDMRLVDAFNDAAAGEVQTKLSMAVERIHGVWTRTHEQRSTQLVFCDLSTPDPNKFSVYRDLKSRLAHAGVPEHEIAFIHDADSDAEKKLLFDAVNAGRTRILIGSTEKMGAGTNVQRRLAALHHLDAPWRPRDIEQREGRILRQGNMNGEVSIYRYVTEGSFDAYMWQTLETKARFIQQVMNGQTSVRSAEDLDGGALTYAEIKAIASGNPAVMEKVKVDTEIRKLDQLRSAHLSQQNNIRFQMRSLPGEIDRRRDRVARIESDIARRDRETGDGFSMIVGNKEFSGKGAREAAADAINEVVLSWRDDMSLQVRAGFRGFEVLSRGRKPSNVFVEDDENLPELFVRGDGLYNAQLNAANPLGTMQSIEHSLRGLERALADESAYLGRAEKSLAEFKEQAGKPFEHEARLKELLVRQADLNAALDLNKGERQVAADDSADGESVEPETKTGDSRRPRPLRERFAASPADQAETDVEAENETQIPVGPRKGPGL